MSYVISIRRSESEPPFAREELERLAQSHAELVLGQGVLMWMNAAGDSVELFVGERELRADRIPAAVSKQAVGVFQVLARELNAQLIGEEDENLAAEAPSSPPEPQSIVLGAILALVALPVTLLLLLVRLPWVLWKARKGLK